MPWGLARGIPGATHGAESIVLVANSTAIVGGYEHEWLVDSVARLSTGAGIPMPEVAIYDGEPNAFATGASKNNSLVAVSTGLLQTMSREEAEAVLASARIPRRCGRSTTDGQRDAHGRRTASSGGGLRPVSCRRTFPRRASPVARAGWHCSQAIRRSRSASAPCRAADTAPAPRERT